MSVLRFDATLQRSLASAYTSPSQLVRVLSERWVRDWVRCARCGHALRPTRPNAKVLDFECSACAEPFELKAMRGTLKGSVMGGAYATMLQRVRSERPPNYLLLAYVDDFMVQDLVLVPGRMLDASLIERRAPLAEGARRAGWVGCTIRFGGVAASGRIPIVERGMWTDAAGVRSAFAAVAGVRDAAEAVGWYDDVRRCVERLPADDFELADVYVFEEELRTRHPTNRDVRAKIRQQLQRLRDDGRIVFLGQGRYRRRPTPSERADGTVDAATRGRAHPGER